jgi:hypothetical protein
MGRSFAAQHFQSIFVGRLPRAGVIRAADAIRGETMTTAPDVTLCVAADAAVHEDAFRAFLDRLLDCTPIAGCELRMGFSQAPACAYYAIGKLCPDEGDLISTRLPGDFERFSWTMSAGRPAHLWLTPRSLTQGDLLACLIGDVSITTDYVIVCSTQIRVRSGWWLALRPLAQQAVDYFGRAARAEYTPEQQEELRLQPWYRGLPFQRFGSRAGISYVTPDLVGIRTARLRDAGGVAVQALALRSTLGHGWAESIGEIAHQLQWKFVSFEIDSDSVLNGERVDSH